MNCPQCGKRVWSDWLSCRYCGVSLRNGSSAAMAISIAEDSELKGVGGWLLVFCILLILGGAWSLFTAFSPFKAGFLSILEFLSGIAGFAMGIYLCTVGKSAFLFLKICFIVTICVRLLELLVVVIALLSGTDQDQLELGVALMIRFISLGITIAWIGYFRYSQRVKNTYGSNLFLFSKIASATSAIDLPGR